MRKIQNKKNFVETACLYFFRIRNSSYRLSRPPNHIGRYKMIRHEKRERAVNR